MKGWCTESKDESGNSYAEVGGTQNRPTIGGYPVGDHSTTKNSQQENNTV